MANNGVGCFNCVVFTHNNPTEALVFDPAEMQYLVYQEEIGASGTYHFQGYCEFLRRKRLNAAKLLLGGPGVHIEGRRGTQAQAIAYCKKEATRIPHTEIVEEGEPKQQGKRVDLEGFKDAIKAGAKLRDLVDDHFGILARYPKFYSTLTSLNRPERSEELVVTLLIGPTGLGKTRRVMDEFGQDPNFFIAPLSNGTCWYDGYDGHTTVLLDDFAGAASHCSLCFMLRLLDRYPVPVPTKGSHTWWMPNKVFVTTNVEPRHWYKWENRGEQYVALARRFAKVYLYYVPLSDSDCGFIEQHRATWWRENAPQEAAHCDYSSL